MGYIRCGGGVLGVDHFVSDGWLVPRGVQIHLLLNADLRHGLCRDPRGLGCLSRREGEMILTTTNIDTDHEIIGDSMMMVSGTVVRLG